MVTETISLGILSLPKAVASLGLAPAIVILIGLGLLSSYTGYVIGRFKLKHPYISNMADAGEALWGPFGREIVGAGQLLFLIFIMASHTLTFTTAMNTLTNHGTCSIVFGIVGMILSCILSLPRTLTKMTWQSIACELLGACLYINVWLMIILACTSIVVAVFITMVALGIQNSGASVKVTVDADLVTGFTAAANIVFSYGK